IGIGEIQRDSEFAGVAIGEQAGGVGAELVVKKRLERARGIDSGGRFDSDHGGAVVSKNPGRSGAGHDPHEVADFYVLERQMIRHQMIPARESSASSRSLRPSSSR